MIKSALILAFLYPSDAQPLGGVFIRERMQQVAKLRSITILSPQPWSPFDNLIRRFGKPKYRPSPKNRDTVEDGIRVFRPRFLSLPGIARYTDGISMAISAWLTIRRENLAGKFDLIDSHFAFPEGYAAYRLSKIYKVPYTIPLRGARDTDTVGTSRETMLRSAIKNANFVIGVSDSLRGFAVEMGAQSSRCIAITNGVDTNLFFPEDRAMARQRLGISLDAPVLISVGSLIPLKGHHRVIEALPEIIKVYPSLKFLIVGGATGFGDTSELISATIHRLGLKNHVMLCGRVNPDQLRWYLSAANVFTLATQNEGWPNALMEALACNLPIVTTQVGGNAEIVHDTYMGSTVPYWDEQAFIKAVLFELNSNNQDERRLQWAASRSWTQAAQRVTEIWDRCESEARTS